MERIRELDGIRAIAILLVIGCHYKGFARLFWGLPEFGWVGVDIFFVLSGYLITTILLGLKNDSAPFKVFYSRRAARIFPPYFAVTSIIFVIALILHLMGSHQGDFALQIRFVIRQLLFLQAYSAQFFPFLADFILHLRWYALHPPALLLYAHHLPSNSAGLQPSLDEPSGTFWSLSIEEYFYVLWAPIVLKLSRRHIMVAGIIVCVTEVILRWYSPGGVANYFNLFLHFDTLVYGAFLALAIEACKLNGIPKGVSSLLRGLLIASLAGITAILCAIRPIVGYDVRASPLFLVLGLPLISVAIAVVLGLLVLRAKTDWWLARCLRADPLQYLGTVSYTMYLTHILSALLVVTLFSALARSLPHHSLLVEAVLSFLLTVLLSRLSWRYFEKPLLRWKDRRFPPSPVVQSKLKPVHTA